MSKAYLSMAMITELGVEVMGVEKKLPVSQHADGLIGVLPVFDSEQHARAYSDREVTLLSVTDPPTQTVKENP